MSYFFSRWLLRVMLYVCFRIRTVGTEYEPLSGPVIICSNHRSSLDPPFVGCFLKRKVHFMAKAELFKVPVFSSMIRSYGAFPVQRGGMTMDTMKSAIKLLKDGRMMAVFPEGTRQKQKTHALGAGKKGAASIALRSGAQILPVAIIGDYRLFRPMTVAYGKPFDPRDAVGTLPASEQTEALTAKIMSSIQELLDRHL